MTPFISLVLLTLILHRGLKGSYLPKNTIRNFFNQMPKTVPIFCDNQGAIALAKHAVFHKRTKHISVKYHAIRAYIKDNTIHLSYIPSKDNLADMFTKALNGNKIRSFANQVHGKWQL